MLIALGVIELKDGGTQPYRNQGHWNSIVVYPVTVDAVTRKLTRVLQA
jgi:hypothetical protein